MMLTIGELASLVGITVRTVRHYHAIGLLPEPPRDHSGYRRYGAQALIQAARIKVLADAGVPLARIPSLLEARPDELHAAIDEIDRRVAEQIERLQAVRASLHGLRTGSAPALPQSLTSLLGILRQAGVGERTIRYERDGWIMLRTLYPGEAEQLIAAKGRLLTDPEVVWLYRRLGEAIDWEPDDDRIEALAREVLARVTVPPADALPEAGERTRDRMLALLSSYSADGPPSWNALRRRVQELTTPPAR